MKKYTVLLLMIFITACSININFNNDETKKDNNIVKYDDELKFETISIKCENDMTNIIAKVTNNTGKTSEKEEIKIVVYLTNGKIEVLPGYFGGNLKQGQTRTINSTIDKNLCNYYKIEYLQ